LRNGGFSLLCHLFSSLPIFAASHRIFSHTANQIAETVNDRGCAAMAAAAGHTAEIPNLIHPVCTASGSDPDFDLGGGFAMTGKLLAVNRDSSILAILSHAGDLMWSAHNDKAFLESACDFWSQYVIDFSALSSIITSHAYGASYSALSSGR
jgi:hypothetical protein